jgi:hypothetical protein
MVIVLTSLIKNFNDGWLKRFNSLKNEYGSEIGSLFQIPTCNFLVKNVNEKKNSFLLINKFCLNILSSALFLLMPWLNHALYVVFFLFSSLDLICLGFMYLLVFSFEIFFKLLILIG